MFIIPTICKRLTGDSHCHTVLKAKQASSALSRRLSGISSGQTIQVIGMSFVCSLDHSDDLHSLRACFLYKECDFQLEDVRRKSCGMQVKGERRGGVQQEQGTRVLLPPLQQSPA